MFHTNFEAIHHDPEQWPCPEEFQPERFDTKTTDNKWLLDHKGKQRSPQAFCPFMGGKRICVGKTFVEVMTKFTLPMLMHYLEFDFREGQPEKPYYGFGGTKEVDLRMRVTTRRNAI